MFDLITSFSRYYFLFLAVLFLWMGISYILNERGIKEGNSSLCDKYQFIVILLFYAFAMPIIAYRPGSEPVPFDLDTAVYGVGAVVFTCFAKFTSARIYKDSCPLLWNGLFFLLSIGFIELQRLNPELASRQLLFCFGGFMVVLLIPLAFKIIPRLEKLELVYIFLSLGLLGLVLFAGNTQYGALISLTLGPVSFQPSEFAKILFVFYLASALYEQQRNQNPIRIAMVCGLSAVLVIMLVAQRDLGGALIFFMTFMIMLYTATGSFLLFSLGFAGASGAAVLAHKIFAHVQTRVAVWQNPWLDISDKGYQITQSLFAITSYGPFGAGLTQGYSSAIPVVERDFIFSALCEEFGVAFGFLLLGVYIMVFYRGVHIALRCNSPLYSLLAVGLTGILAFQTFVIIAGDINLIPMTGVTLPFVSYGGSSVFISVIMAGALEWLYSRIPQEERLREKEREALRE